MNRRVRKRRKEQDQTPATRVGRVASIDSPVEVTPPAPAPKLPLEIAIPRAVEILRNVEDELKKIRTATDLQVAKAIVTREYLEVAWANHISTQRLGIRRPTTIDGFLVV